MQPIQYQPGQPMLGAGGGVHDLISILMGGLPQGPQQGQPQMPTHTWGAQGAPAPGAGGQQAWGSPQWGQGQPGKPAPVSARAALVQRAMGQQ